MLWGKFRNLNLESEKYFQLSIIQRTLQGLNIPCHILDRRKYSDILPRDCLQVTLIVWNFIRKHQSFAQFAGSLWCLKMQIKYSTNIFNGPKFTCFNFTFGRISEIVKTRLSVGFSFRNIFFSIKFKSQ